MVEGVHGNAGARKNAAESANPPFIGPPTARSGYEPPNVNDGYDKFIQDILSDGHCDTFQGPRPEGDKKKEDRIQKFLQWSGIAFGVAAAGAILKKSLAYAKNKGIKAGQEMLEQGAKRL